MIEKALLSAILSMVTLLLVVIAYKINYGLTIIAKDPITYLLLAFYFLFFYSAIKLISINNLYKKRKELYAKRNKRLHSL